MGIFSYIKHRAIYKYCEYSAKSKSSKTYPESIEIDLNDLLSERRLLRVAIIDDVPFPWIDAIERLNCKVTYYADYIKPIKQSNQRIKTYDLSSQDVILCDIDGIGTSIYPDRQGVAVMEDLRRSNPFHVIAAYTGMPGQIYSKRQKPYLLDTVFSRDWGQEDFLFNFSELVKIFEAPKNRWDFVKKRLTHLEVGEKRIDEIRRSFVENVIMCQLLKHKFNFSAPEIRNIVLSSTNGGSSIDVQGLAKFGISVAELTSLVSPFILEAAK